jgi:hypothetical protein
MCEIVQIERKSTMRFVVVNYLLSFAWCSPIWTHAAFRCLIALQNIAAFPLFTFSQSQSL